MFITMLLVDYYYYISIYFYVHYITIDNCYYIDIYLLLC